MMDEPKTRIGQEELARLKDGRLLVATVASHVELKPNGREFIGLCPFHCEKTPSFHVVPDKGFFHCFGCGASGDAISFLQSIEQLSFSEAVQKLNGAPIAARGNFVPLDPQKQKEDEAVTRKKKILAARKIWDESQLAFGTIVENYFAARGLDGVMVPPSIRFHPRLWNAEASQFMPAMICCVMARGQIVGIHRTYLRADGRGKARVKMPKKMLGACHGGYAQLYDYGAKLVVAEGIETALSIRKACLLYPVWAALSLTNMDAKIPKGVRELILCADGDNKDPEKADAVLAKAALCHAQGGRRVRVARPRAGMDFNDMVRQGVG